MPKFQDLTGKTFSYLTVIERLPKTKDGKNRWLCKCKCGKYTTPITHNLLSGKVQSCGCLRKLTTTHGKSNERIYAIWCDMKKRCYDKNCKSFNRYGGAGVSMCEDWKNDFMSFYEWSMSHGYNDSLSIDRIDNNKGYSPDNCRWSTMLEQARNKKRTIYIEHNGETKPLSVWCEIYDYPYKSAIQRYKNHIKKGEAFTLNDLLYKGNRTYKKLAQYTQDGDLVKIWDKVTDTRKAGYNITGIYKCLNGQFRTSGGFVWKYADD